MPYYPKPKDFVPEEYFPEDHSRYPGKKRCRGWSKNQGRQCRKAAVVGKNTCQTHNGKALSGKDHPNAKHLRYSKDIHVSLAKRYEEFIDDPQRLELYDEIAINTARSALTLANMDGAVNLKLLGKIIEMVTGIKTALTVEDDQKAALLTIDDLLALCERAKEVKFAEAEYDKLVEQRVNLVGAVVKNQKDRQQTLAVNVVVGMMVAMANDFREILLKHMDEQSARPILIDAGEAARKRVLAGSS